MKKIREKAIKRYLNGESLKRINQEIEQMVIAARRRLENKLYTQIRALNIFWQLRQEGIKPPSIATINRILKRNNLIQRREKYAPKGTSHPSLCVTQSNDLHQMDVIGPRYLKGDGRFYSINIIDAFDRRGTIYPSSQEEPNGYCKRADTLLAYAGNTLIFYSD